MIASACVEAAREFLVGVTAESAAAAEEAVMQLAAFGPEELSPLASDLQELALLAVAAAGHYRQLLAIYGITGADYEPAVAHGSVIRA